MVPLFDLKEGDIGEIVEISDKTEIHGRNGHHGRHGRCHCRHARINDLGLRVGKVVTLLQKQGRGPLLVKVDESRIAIGRGMAERIKIGNLH